MKEFWGIIVFMATAVGLASFLVPVMGQEGGVTIAVVGTILILGFLFS